MVDNVVSWNDFLKLIDTHDLTYEMSEDGSKYRKGAAEMTIIRLAAQSFPSGNVERAWNAMCDRKSPKNGSMFYWS